MNTAVFQQTIHFGSQSVLVQSDSVQCGRLIGRFLGHCFGANRERQPAATFTLTAVTPTTIQLCQNNQPILTSRWQTVFPYFMHHMLEALITHYEDGLVFHAGGVARQGHGIMLCGQSGQGKSTFTARLLTAHFDYLSDEVTAVSLDQPGRQRIIGFPRSIILRQGSAFIWRNALPGGVLPEEAALDDGTVWLRPDWLGQGRVQPEGNDVQMVIFPRFEAGADFSARPLSAGELAFSLMQHLVNAKNVAGHGLTAVSQFARQLTGWQLVYGNVDMAAAWLEETVQSL
ncbi:MAG: hypothetical protein Kow0080_19300 [Candidatus Promineifilaceae bacterium]